MTKLIVFIVIGVLFVIQKPINDYYNEPTKEIFDIFLSTITRIIIVGIAYLILF